MRYTERHAGKAVIRDKSLLPEAMEKLARVEELEDIPGLICDRYCVYPNTIVSQKNLDAVCDQCELKRLFEVLEDDTEQTKETKD